MKNSFNIIIPCAGQGSRFFQQGYTLPKPLIPVGGKPMLQWVIDSLNLKGEPFRYIFLVLQEHIDKYQIDKKISLLMGNQEHKFIPVNKVTEGAACTVLLAKAFINDENPLIICNSDQYFRYHQDSFIYDINHKNMDGVIFTFTSDGNKKWSYAKVEANGIISQVAEKRLLDDNNDATVGCYYFRYGNEFVKYAEQMIAQNIRTNNEFYLCPVYQEFINDGKIITNFQVNEMWGLGTPEDAKIFEEKRI